jgi:hypothetical protein
MHSRVSSGSSISSIVDEHGSSSPLNKAMETFTDASGVVAGDFVQQLKHLNSDNSKGDLCIEKYLEKAEKAHFVLLKKEKVSGKTEGSSTHESRLTLFPPYRSRRRRLLDTEALRSTPIKTTTRTSCPRSVSILFIIADLRRIR